MRSGDLDNLVRILRPGPLAREGRSRVPGEDVLVADRVPARLQAGVGTERFASAENIATAPAVFIIRREPDVENIEPRFVLVHLLEVDGEMVEGDRYDIKSVREWPPEPRQAWEVSCVRLA